MIELKPLKTFKLTIALDIQASDLEGARMVAGTALEKLGFVGARIDHLAEVTPRRTTVGRSDLLDDSHSPQGRN